MGFVARSQYLKSMVLTRLNYEGLCWSLDTLCNCSIWSKMPTCTLVIIASCDTAILKNWDCLHFKLSCFYKYLVYQWFRCLLSKGKNLLTWHCLGLAQVLYTEWQMNALLSICLGADAGLVWVETLFSRSIFGPEQISSLLVLFSWRSWSMWSDRLPQGGMSPLTKNHIVFKMI